MVRCVGWCLLAVIGGVEGWCLGVMEWVVWLL